MTDASTTLGAKAEETEFIQALNDSAQRAGDENFPEASVVQHRTRPRVREDEPFAVITQTTLREIANSMPDAQAAVLVALAWQAERQKRLTKGEHAGKPVARLSGATLAEWTGRPLRTVRWALAKLKQNKLVNTVASVAGRTGIYTLTFANHSVAHTPKRNLAAPTNEMSREKPSPNSDPSKGGSGE